MNRFATIALFLLVASHSQSVVAGLILSDDRSVHSDAGLLAIVESNTPSDPPQGVDEDAEGMRLTHSLDLPGTMVVTHPSTAVTVSEPIKHPERVLPRNSRLPADPDLDGLLEPPQMLNDKN